MAWSRKFIFYVFEERIDVFVLHADNVIKWGFKYQYICFKCEKENNVKNEFVSEIKFLGELNRKFPSFRDTSFEKVYLINIDVVEI